MVSERYALAGDYLIRFGHKPPGAVLDYEVDFALQLIDYTPHTILDVVWSVVAVAGDARPLAMASQSFAAGLATFRLSAGTPLQAYELRGQVSWSDGETDVVAVTIPIAYLPNDTVLFPAGIETGERFGLPTVA